VLHVVQNKVKVLSSILVALLPLTSTWAIGLPTHRNIKVTDSESEPVADAEVVVGWSWGGSWTEDFFWKDPAQNWTEEAHFFMKVRSDEESGACYAILRNPPKFSYRAGDMAWITFDYFFNPANSRNLEYEKDKNMMKEFRRYRLEEYKPGYP
jgi:hypothetical protein